MRRLPIQLAVVAMLFLTMGPATADTLVTATLEQVSGVSPFAAGCGLEPTGEGAVFVGSEVEPFVDINPANPANLIAVWQQDRWSNGGSRGNAAGVSLNGGATWQIVTFPDVTVCTGGEFDRASDPWV